MDDDEINFLPERDIYNRVGTGGFFDLQPDYSQKNTSNMFPIIVNAVSRAMMEENIIKISELDIAHLLETTNNPKVKKKYFIF